MGLTMKDRRKITKELDGRYQRAHKKGKGMIPDAFVQLTGCASHILQGVRESISSSTPRKRAEGKEQEVV